MSFWTEARDRQLEALLERGLSAAKIAAEMGTTRNAVIGRKHRRKRTLFPYIVEHRRQMAENEQSRRAARAERRARATAVFKREIASGRDRRAAARAARAVGAALVDIAAELGVSRERARQIIIHKRAV